MHKSIVNYNLNYIYFLKLPLRLWHVLEVYLFLYFCFLCSCPIWSSCYFLKNHINHIYLTTPTSTLTQQLFHMYYTNIAEKIDSNPFKFNNWSWNSLKEKNIYTILEPLHLLQKAVLYLHVCCTKLIQN